jgi:hypothetical protein
MQGVRFGECEVCDLVRSHAGASVFGSEPPVEVTGLERAVRRSIARSYCAKGLRISPFYPFGDRIIARRPKSLRAWRCPNLTNPFCLPRTKSGRPGNPLIPSAGLYADPPGLSLSARRSRVSIA